MKKNVILMAMTMASLFVGTAWGQGIFSNKEYDGGNQDLTAYVIGTVPEVDGQVVFSTTIDVPLTKAELYQRLAQWAAFRFAPETENSKWPKPDYFKNTAYARILNADKDGGTMKIQGNEDLVFTNKTLAKDMSVVSYILRLTATDGKVEAVMDNIAYTYNLSDTPERIAAEDWITDATAFNKRGKLRKVNGKFRVKTIDLKDALFDDLKRALTN